MTKSDKIKVANTIYTLVTGKAGRFCAKRTLGDRVMCDTPEESNKLLNALLEVGIKAHINPVINLVRIEF